AVIEFDGADHGQVGRATDDEIEVLPRDAIERRLPGGLPEPRFDCRNVRDAHLAENPMLWTDSLIQYTKKRPFCCREEGLRALIGKAELAGAPRTALHQGEGDQDDHSECDQ